jgi:hypothetical protein
MRGCHVEDSVSITLLLETHTWEHTPSRSGLLFDNTIKLNYNMKFMKHRQEPMSSSPLKGSRVSNCPTGNPETL